MNYCSPNKTQLKESKLCKLLSFVWPYINPYLLLMWVFNPITPFPSSLLIDWSHNTLALLKSLSLECKQMLWGSSSKKKKANSLFFFSQVVSPFVPPHLPTGCGFLCVLTPSPSSHRPPASRGGKAAWNRRGRCLSIFMLDLKSDYIWARSIDLMDLKRLDPINKGIKEMEEKEGKKGWLRPWGCGGGAPPVGQGG